MNEAPSITPASVGVIYCAACNERFFRPTQGDVCPRCGMPVQAVADTSTLDTLFVKQEDAPSRRKTPRPPQEDSSDRLIGQRLHVYECESLIGQGAMGRVYLAKHVHLHRRCALKILSPRANEIDADYVARFYQEGRSAAALVHPHVVTTHAIGEADGLHYLEMEFIPGRSLQQVIQMEGRIPPVRAACLAAQIAQGLAVAHWQNILHRDLKPDNVLLTYQGVPKIADFGLAKRVQRDDRARGELLAGTPHYMAPEVLSGASASPASDVYALGVCLFLMLSGRLPHVAGNLADLEQRVNSDPVPNIRAEFPDIPLELAECVNQLLAKSPANRPADGTEAAQLLHAVVGEARDLEALLVEAFEPTADVAWTRNGSVYRLSVKLPAGRQQTLYIEPADPSGGDRLVLIYSVCCPAKPEFFESALRLNAVVAHGGVALREIDGQPYFVMIDTYPRATIDAEEIRKSVLEIARHADDVERRLTNDDKH